MFFFLFSILYLFLVNLLAYVCYGADKSKAKQGKRRISERCLIFLAFLGGGLGAWCAMRRFRHKTLHAKFRILVPVAFFLWLLPSLDILTVFATQRGTIFFTPLMLRRAVEAHSDKDAKHPYNRHFQWVPYSDISPTLTRAVIASEDNLFASHHGFSERGIRQALAERLEKGHVKHGGSTISQQTAKNVFTFGSRSVLRKLREAWLTVLIEQMWGKQRIMEVYLNVIEMGNGIYGAEAASRQYFHHSAGRLSSSESALLAACLPSPRKYSVTHPGPYMRKRQSQILNLMPKMGKIILSSPDKSPNMSIG